MKRTALRRLWPFAILLLSLPVSVMAFAISPLKYTITVDPGSAQVLSMTIKNDEASEQKFILSVVGIEQDAAGHPLFAHGIDVAESWVKPETLEVRIKAGETKKVIFTAAVPRGVPPGSHYIGLAAEPQNNVANAAVAISGRLVTIVHLEVAGVVREALSVVAKLSASLPSTNGWVLNIELQNTGTTAFGAEGKINVYNWRGNSVTTQDVVIGNELIPGTHRLLTISPIPFPRWPGPYRINTVISYGERHQAASSQLSVWYLPTWSLIVGASFLIVAILLVIIIVRRKRQKHY